MRAENIKLYTDVTHTGVSENVLSSKLYTAGVGTSA